MALRIDFGGTYNDAQKKHATEIYEKITNVFAKFRMSDQDFFQYLKSNISGFYFSSANFEREAESRQNGDRVIRNIFVRPEIDSEFSQLLKGNGFLLIGDVIIRPRNEQSYFSVNDFYLCENSRALKYETYISGSVNLRTQHEDMNLSIYNTILNFEFIEQIPYIISPAKFNSFISKWENYLEFEYELTKIGIDYKKPTKNIEFNVLYEVKANDTNRETFAKDIMVEFEKNIYVKESSQYLTGEENQYVFASVTIDDEKGLKSFFNQTLSLVGSKNVKKLDALKQGEDIEDIPQIVLGEYITQEKLADGKIRAYFYVPDAISDDGTAALDSFLDTYKNILEDKPVIASTASGDIALHTRGKRAIENLKKGKVKNPYLAGLLIDPTNFETSVDLYNEDNIQFALDKLLNKSQKNAIIKALNSNSIFAIQGPPGTGKTQTITELVYQYNKMGKKVLLSSQTHIAIDNVIERLPKEMNILPIRLVKDTKRANKQYLPDKLLDNLYSSAYYRFLDKIETYNSFAVELEKIKSEYESNFELFKAIKERQRKCKELDERISISRKEAQQVADDLIECERKAKQATMYKDFVLEYYNNELDFNLITGDFEVPQFVEVISKLFESWGLEQEDSLEDYLFSLKRRCGNDRITMLNKLSEGSIGKSKEYLELEAEIEKQKTAIQTMESMNNTAMAPAIEAMKSNINTLFKKLKELDDNSNVKVVDLSNTKLFFAKDKSKPENAVKDELDAIAKMLDEYKNAIKKLMTAKFIKSLEEVYDNTEKDGLEKEYKRLNVILAKLNDEYKEMFTPIKTQQERLTSYFNDFFIEKLNDNSLPEDDEAKFARIDEYIQMKLDEFKQAKSIYEKYKDIYKDTVELLKDRKDFIGRQRIDFTKKLFTNNANVYGITCTSSATFKSDRNEYLKALEIGDVDVSKQDFDVIIIDEVSKATPIEIMIPLLYGKNVVLVGDQRQLPPIFKYRDSMFKDMPVDQQQRLFKNATLDDFKNQVENSLFEEIYNLLSTNRAMLNQQYRFNSQIMNCVNVFYSDMLEAGWGSAQDNKKQHYLRVNYKRGDRETIIFDPKYSTYWFNSHKYADDNIAYEKIKDGKTSLFNELEAQLTLELLKLLDEGYSDLKKNDKPTYDKVVGDSETGKPSVAVVTMYGAQIGHIKHLMKSNPDYKFSNLDLDISTVDNYQGKEKDIIIVNFVRNNKHGEAGEFIKKFNRINVAISRARNMLIMVGSKEFCSNLAINVPDMGSSKEKLTHAYGTIFDRCEMRFNHASGIFGIKLKKGGK